MPPAEIVNGQYRNRRYASVVPRPVFVGGKPVAEALITLPAQPARKRAAARRLAGDRTAGGKSPVVAAQPNAAGSSVAAKLAKARDTLARILKSARAEEDLRSRSRYRGRRS